MAVREAPPDVLTQAQREKLNYEAGARFTKAYWMRQYSYQDSDLAEAAPAMSLRPVQTLWLGPGRHVLVDLQAAPAGAQPVPTRVANASTSPPAAAMAPRAPIVRAAAADDWLPLISPTRIPEAVPCNPPRTPLITAPPTP